jgi:hypothetical protein
MNKILLIITIFVFTNCSNHQSYIESEEAKMDRAFEEKVVVELNKIRIVKKQTLLRVKDEADRSSSTSKSSAFDAQMRR